MTESNQNETEKKQNVSKGKTTTTRKKASTAANQKKELTLNEKLLNVIDEIRLTEDGKIEINGKKYTTVAKRNEVFRKMFGFDAKTITEILHMEGDDIIMKATISIYKNEIWQEIATAHAQENRNQSQMNLVSALENAETSAIGRALSNLGISGGEFASLDEITGKAKNASKEKPEEVKKMINKFQKEKIEKEFSKNENFEKHYLKEYNIKTINDLTFKEANDIIKEISSHDLNESNDEEVKIL